MGIKFSRSKLMADSSVVGKMEIRQCNLILARTGDMLAQEDIYKEVREAVQVHLSSLRRKGVNLKKIDDEDIISSVFIDMLEHDCDWTGASIADRTRCAIFDELKGTIPIYTSNLFIALLTVYFQYLRDGKKKDFLVYLKRKWGNFYMSSRHADRCFFLDLCVCSDYLFGTAIVKTGDVDLAIPTDGIDLESKLFLQDFLKSKSKLTDRELHALYLYYYEEKTLDDITEDLNLSRERVRQIIAKALRKLRLKCHKELGGVPEWL